MSEQQLTRARADSLSLAVIEDDDELREALVRGLSEEGFRIGLAARRGRDLLAARLDRLDAVVLDIGLPDADGRDVLASLRAAGSAMPILLLTARGELVDRISGFHAGADDYLVKPFSFDELVLRLRSLGRRAAAAMELPAVGLAPGSLTRVDHARHVLCHSLREVPLTPTEFRMMAALVARRGEVVRRASLTSAGWPHGEMVLDNTLDSYVARLRRDLRAVESPATIATIRGVGYRLDE